MALNPDALIADCGALASLPEVVAQVNEVLHDPLASSADVARVIETDAALSAQLLKIVNSPYYGFPSHIDTISRAVTVIGGRDLAHLLLATSTIKAFDRLSADMPDMRRLWHHNLYCGVLSRLLAEQRRDPHPERFFVAGLLHDLGHLVLLGTVPDQVRRCREVVGNGGIPLHMAEQELLGINHAELGGRLAHAWRLPAPLTEAIATHHAPGLARHYRVEAATVHIADFIAHGLHQAVPGDEERPRLEPGAWEQAELTPQALDTVLAQAEVRYADACATLLPAS